MPNTIEAPTSPRHHAHDRPRAETAPFGGLYLGRYGGVEVVADWSLLLIFALVVYNLALQVFPTWHPGWDAKRVWLVAFAAAGLFWASIWIHEMAHAWVGRAVGLPIRRLTLFLFGGAAHLEREPSSPKAELLTAVAGPITSVLVGIGALMAAAALAGPDFQAAVQSGDPATVAVAVANLGAVPTLLFWLGPINVVLALFNLIPGFPLDGGRVLRSLLWLVSGDIVKATRWASTVGRVIAWILIAWGIWLAFLGSFLSGLWLMLIGWFLGAAALGSYRQLLSRNWLHDVPVDTIMRTQLLRVGPGTTVERFVHDYLMTTDQRGFPVEMAGKLVGLVTFDDVRRVHQDRWKDTTVDRIMTPLDRLSVVTPEAPTLDILRPFGHRGEEQIPVVRGEHLVGMIQRADVMKWLALRQLNPNDAV